MDDIWSVGAQVFIIFTRLLSLFVPRKYADLQIFYNEEDAVNRKQIVANWVSPPTKMPSDLAQTIFQKMHDGYNGDITAMTMSNHHSQR